jgi:SAM-dependent methyltransferase
MRTTWDRERLLEMQRAFQGACVLLAAAELDLFTVLGDRAMTARAIARKIAGDPRATAALADALAAMRLLTKASGRYRAADGVAEAMSDQKKGNVLAMAQHQANCLRRWAELARVVRTGRPARRVPSIRGEKADYASFVEAMDNVSAPMAGPLVARIKPGRFDHLLDVGGGSGSWTIAFLRANPRARATIFDLPRVGPQARARIASAGLSDRVRFVGGDYTRDELPRGADLAWVSAIVHSLSRRQNRALFRKVRRALARGGRMLVRDILMDESRTRPPSGALFAINMLVGTEGGGTYTLDELAADLKSAGFGRVRLVVRDEGMNSVVEAVRR